MISTKYKDLYLSTTKEQFKKLSTLLLYLEKKPASQNLIENIFRLIHSMKGAAATMSYKKTVNLLHAMESVVDAAYNGDLRINQKILNSFFDILDILKQNFNSIDKHNKEIVLTKQIKLIKTLLNQKNTKDASKQKKEKHILGSLPSVAELTVSTDKLDDIGNSLDDLLINAMKIKNKAKGSEDVDFLKVCVDNDKILANLRRQLEKIRIVPLKDVLSSLPYLVREIARNENKQVEIVIKDHNISLDKAIVDEIVEILIQLLKNAVAHGIASKPVKGKIIVDFSLVGDRMYISVEDNGQGINWQDILALAIKNKIISSQKAKTMTIDQIKKFIFQAGISKGRNLNTVSGRGIGLSLVKAKTEELGGSIEVISKINKGTKFIIDLPQPLSVFRSIIFNLLGYVFALPLDFIDKIINLDDVKNLNKTKIFTYKKNKYKLISLLNIFDIKNFEPLYKYIALINYKGSKVALPIIRQVQEDELIMKKAPLIFKNNKYIKGVAVSAQGQAILVLDINNLI
ncbi:MAG: ATP-binding protein [Patescibacteria group bacterium]|jgi:two-component system chemotaxis sensor kinase CheA